MNILTETNRAPSTIVVKDQPLKEEVWGLRDLYIPESPAIESVPVPGDMWPSAYCDFYKCRRSTWAERAPSAFLDFQREHLLACGLSTIRNTRRSCFLVRLPTCNTNHFCGSRAHRRARRKTNDAVLIRGAHRFRRPWYRWAYCKGGKNHGKPWRACSLSP